MLFLHCSVLLVIALVATRVPAVPQNAPGSQTGPVTLASIGGAIAGPVSVVSLSANALDVFGRHKDDGSLRRRAWRNGVWQPWESLGGVTRYAPSCISWGSNRIDCFVVALGNNLCQLLWDGTSWQGWFCFDGQLSEAPSCTTDASRPATRVDCYGKWTDGTLRRRSWRNDRGWIDWVNLGKPTATVSVNSAPACVLTRTADGTFSNLCYVIGSDKQMYQHACGDTTAAGNAWTAMGESLQGNPGVLLNADGTIRLFARGTDNRWKKRNRANEDGLWREWKSFSSTLGVRTMHQRPGQPNSEVWTVGSSGQVTQMAEFT